MWPKWYFELELERELEREREREPKLNSYVFRE